MPQGGGGWDKKNKWKDEEALEKAVSPVAQDRDPATITGNRVPKFSFKKTH